MPQSAESLKNLKKGGAGGRPRGSLNKSTLVMKEHSRLFLESPKYRQSAERRMIAGKAPHLESIYHGHAYGKPKDSEAGDGNERYIWAKPGGQPDGDVSVAVAVDVKTKPTTRKQKAARKK